VNDLLGPQTYLKNTLEQACGWEDGLPIPLVWFNVSMVDGYLRWRRRTSAALESDLRAAQGLQFHIERIELVNGMAKNIAGGIAIGMDVARGTRTGLPDHGILLSTRFVLIIPWAEPIDVGVTQFLKTTLELASTREGREVVWCLPLELSCTCRGL
jgi:hypothetical protein